MAMTRKTRRELYRESVKRTSGKYRTTQNAIEKAIANPTDKDAMIWGPAYAFNAETFSFDILEMPGSKQVTPAVPNWYRTVRTDTTDRQDTAKDSVSKRSRW